MEKEREIKLRNKLLNDSEFRNKCNLYEGVDYRKFHLYENPFDGNVTIFVCTPDENVYILMDMEYNTIGIHRFDETKDNDDLYSAFLKKTLGNDLAYAKVTNYYYKKNDSSSGYFSISIGDICKISDRIIVSEAIKGKSLMMMVNGEYVDLKHGKLYIELLSYVAFLGKLIDIYYQNLYHAKLENKPYPEIDKFVQSIVNKIDKYISSCIKDNVRPLPSKLLAAISIDEKTEKLDSYRMAIYYAIDLLLYEKRKMVDKGGEHLTINYEELGNIFTQTYEIKALLDVSKEEVKRRLKEGRRTLN
jgi:hypothetical protein